MWKGGAKNSCRVCKIRLSDVPRTKWPFSALQDDKSTSFSFSSTLWKNAKKRDGVKRWIMHRTSASRLLKEEESLQKLERSEWLHDDLNVQHFQTKLTWTTWSTLTIPVPVGIAMYRIHTQRNLYPLRSLRINLKILLCSKNKNFVSISIAYHFP